MNERETLDWICSEIERVDGVKFNDCGFHQLRLRPDARDFVLDHLAGPDPIIRCGGARAWAEVQRDGTILLTFDSPAYPGRSIILTVVDGETVLVEKVFPAGTITRWVLIVLPGDEALSLQLLDEATARGSLDEAFAWLNEAAQT